MKVHDLSADIAIVGMSATFAGAPDLRTYWENILAKVDAVTEAPESWAAPYFDPQTRRNDRIYTRRGGFLGELANFDPKEFGIMPTSVDGGEPDQYLALRLARDALRDAGYMDRPFNRTRCGVVLGRGTYVNRGYTNLMQHGLVIDQTLELLHKFAPRLEGGVLDELRNALKASLPPFTAESCPGMVPNIVSGRIANRLDLMGPNFIIDAACASSLIAIGLAIDELRAGRCDMMLTGGIHASTPPQIYMIFCQLGGLSHDQIRPFDAAAQGTLLGEGAGVLVLKRLADAERDGDRIYALVKGVGSASDGKALGLLAPRLEGEVTALRRAYEASGVEPATVGLIEAHGTGIPLGDQTEVKSLQTMFGERKGRLPSIAIGSVKSMIGHCIPAAGAAGVIKTAAALSDRILPPTLAAEPNSALGLEATPFYVNSEARPWIHGSPASPRRAGVNAFGFGGINAHVVLEEYCGPAAARAPMINARWPSELVVCAAPTPQALADDLRALARSAQADAAEAFWELARRHSTPGEHPCRAAIVCASRKELAEKAAFLADKIGTGVPRVQTRNGAYYNSHAGARPQTALLFPGEGAQYSNMLADLCRYFPSVRGWFDFLDETYAGVHDYAPSSVVFPAPTGLTEAERALLEQRLHGMDLGAELCFIAGMALHELLEQFGLKADYMLGHSTGENTALVASGTLVLRDRAHLAAKMREWNAVYRELEQDGDIPRGMLLTVGGLPREAIDKALAEAGAGIHLAMDNCPNQVVVFGPVERVTALQDTLGRAGGICMPLPFDRGYHTPLFSKAGGGFRRLYDSIDVRPGHARLASCATADLFPDEAGGIRALAEAQWSRTVRFRETVAGLYERGVRCFVEAGPSGNLTSFVEDILRGRDAVAVASNSRRRSGLVHLQTCLARVFVQGWNLDFSPLYAHRAPARAAPAEASRAAAPVRPRLNLELPRLVVPAPLVEKVRASLAPPAPAAPVVEAAAPAERPVVRSMSVAAAREAPADVVPAPRGAPTDARTAALIDHFGLMQNFLESQQRLLGLLSGQAGAGAGGSTASAMGFGAHMAANPWPLLGRVQSEQADLIVCEREVSLATDPYLRDHTLGGAPSALASELTPLPVVPFTFSMEMVAEAALRLAGPGKVVTAMESLRGYRWLTLDGESLGLRIEARRVPAAAASGDETMLVRIYQRTTGGPLPHVLVFEGRVQVATAYPAAPPAAIALGPLTPSRQRSEELYSTGMFHGPMLRGVRQLRGWTDRGIEADLVTIPTTGFFAPDEPVRFATDAGLLDAAGQLVGYWLSEQFGSDFNCFPFEVVAYRQFAPVAGPGELVRCRGEIRFSESHQIEARFELLDAAGRVVATLDGWRDRYFRMPPDYYACRLAPQTAFLSQPWEAPVPGVRLRKLPGFGDEFLEQSWGIWARVLAHLVLTRTELAQFNALPAEGKRRGEWLLARICAKDGLRDWALAERGLELAPADIEILADAAGKPVVTRMTGVDGPLPEVSLAHSQGMAAAAVVAGGRAIGMDVQCARPLRAADVWAGAFEPDEAAPLRSADPAVDMQTLLVCWTAKEAAAKAAGTGLLGDPRRWRVVACDRMLGKVRIQHGADAYDVLVRSMHEATLALCVKMPAARATVASAAGTV